MTMINMNNTCFVHGRLTRDPKVITRNSGTTYLFTVAAERGYTNEKGEKVADYVPLVGFVQDGKSTGAYKYLEKGKEVMVRYEAESYKQMVNGKPKYGISLRVVPGGITLGASAKNEASQDVQNDIQDPFAGQDVSNGAETNFDADNKDLNDAIKKIQAGKDSLNDTDDLGF